MEDDQQFCLRWNNHQSTLIQNFDTLLESGTLVDCTLAAEGKYLKAHKVVLSACSPYFEGLLSEHYDKHPVFILKDVKFKELKAMMDYMYRGEVNISQDQLSALLKAAESLQIKGLSDSRTGASGGATTGKADTRPLKTASSTTASSSVDIPHGSSGLTIEKNSKVPRQSLQQVSVSDLPEDSASPQLRGFSSREGSQSPTRKKKRSRKRSLGNDDNNSMENHEASNSSDVNISAPALGVAPVAEEKSHADPADSIGRSALMQQLTKPADEMLQIPIEKPEPSEEMIQPKSEYLDDQESVEDLTNLDDDMNDLNEMEQDNSRAGPSHDPSQHPGLASWHIAGDRSNASVVGAAAGPPGSQDEVFLAAHEAAQAQRDSQVCRPIKDEFSKNSLENRTDVFHFSPKTSPKIRIENETGGTLPTAKELLSHIPEIRNFEKSVIKLSRKPRKAGRPKKTPKLIPILQAIQTGNELPINLLDDSDLNNRYSLRKVPSIGVPNKTNENIEKGLEEIQLKKNPAKILKKSNSFSKVRKVLENDQNKLDTLTKLQNLKQSPSILSNSSDEILKKTNKKVKRKVGRPPKLINFSINQNNYNSDRNDGLNNLQQVQKRKTGRPLKIIKTNFHLSVNQEQATTQSTEETNLESTIANAKTIGHKTNILSENQMVIISKSTSKLQDNLKSVESPTSEDSNLKLYKLRATKILNDQSESELQMRRSNSEDIKIPKRKPGRPPKLISLSDNLPMDNDIIAKDNIPRIRKIEILNKIIKRKPGRPPKILNITQKSNEMEASTE